MSVQICRLNLDKDGRELQTRGTPMFPCAAYYTDLAKNVTGEVPWHWHEEIELAVVEKGRARVRLTGLEAVLEEEEGIFINSNVLHSAAIASPDGCVLQSLVFSPSLLSGSPESVFDQKFVRPLISCGSIPGAALLKKAPWQSTTASLIHEAFQAYEDGNYGFEWLVREKLSRFWYSLFTNLRPEADEEQTFESRDSRRIKEMINYVSATSNALWALPRCSI